MDTKKKFVTKCGFYFEKVETHGSWKALATSMRAHNVTTVFYTQFV